MEVSVLNQFSLLMYPSFLPFCADAISDERIDLFVRLQHMKLKHTCCLYKPLAKYFTMPCVFRFQSLVYASFADHTELKRGRSRISFFCEWRCFNHQPSNPCHYFYPYKKNK